MIERRLQRQLDVVAARLRQVRFWYGLALVILVSTLASGIMLSLHRYHGFDFSSTTILIVVISACIVTGAFAFFLHRPGNNQQVATQIERV